MRRGIGISSWGAPAWECPPCPTLETKRSGRRELRAEGIRWQLVHLSARRERLPLTFMNRAELGQPAAVRVREKRRGHAGTGREVERKGTRPRSVTAGAETWPRSPDRGDDAGPARRPTSSITRRTAAGACCQGRMKSSPREARLLFSTNTRHSGSGDSRSGRGAADPRPFPHSAVLRSHTRTFGLPPWSGRISPVPGPAWPSNFVCSSHCLYSRLIFPGLFVKKANFSLQSTNSSLKPSLKQRKSDLPK